ncbi:MAG: component of SufBCD complex [Tabrizicola sp.]|uniref:component of SufBCD complex n=1 Tax=Tabrizicola sp. TaxID=2005166 RepID=UPI002ABB556D|nr:component of SufBCD complex [Tabrizicola sp.]MDZ4088737.1 component of SufBCD complex [Tabrizicola sp.]
MDVLDTALEVIDLRSFSNLWYWIALAAMWSSVSHWVLGVPHDMIQRARREGGQAQADVEDLVRININRLLHVVDSGALLMVALAAFWLAALLVLGFWYDIEFAQAVVLLFAPILLVVWFSVRASRRIVAEAATGEALFRRLTIHRRVVQVIGMLAITVTAFYGTWQNISVSILN